MQLISALAGLVALTGSSRQRLSKGRRWLLSMVIVDGFLALAVATSWASIIG